MAGERIALAEMAETTARVLAALAGTGVVVVRVDAEAEAVLARAEAAARRLLVEAPLYVRRGATLLFAETPAAAAGAAGDAPPRGLAGHNAPTVAKEVFRIRRGGRQPWPEAEAVPGFRDAQEAALALLEGVVDACLAAVDAASGGRWRLRDRYGTAADAWDDATSLSRSPYDLFAYYNDARAAAQVNCHEHVDPGILTCVPCAATPGLELAIDGAWWAAEAAAVDTPPLRPLADIVVFAGATLAAVTDGAIPAVVHRVAKAPQPRLSLVYERRP